jgi:hypothetical protein
MRTFLRALEWKILLYISSPFGIFYDRLVHFVFIWYILYSFDTFCVHLVQFCRFGITYQEKSGNSAKDR